MSSTREVKGTGMATELTEVIRKKLQPIHEKVMKSIKNGNFIIIFEHSFEKLQLYVKQLENEGFPYKLKLTDDTTYKVVYNEYDDVNEKVIDSDSQTLHITG